MWTGLHIIMLPRRGASPERKERERDGLCLVAAHKQDRWLDVVTFSPCGTLLLAVYWAPPDQFKNGAAVLDPTTGKVLARFEEARGRPVWLPHSLTIAYRSGYDTFRLWNPASGKSADHALSGRLDRLLPSRCGTLLATHARPFGSVNDALCVWRVRGAAATLAFETEDARCASCWSPRGSVLAMSTESTGVEILEIGEDAVTRRLALGREYYQRFAQLSWSPCGGKLACFCWLSCGMDQSLVVVDMKSDTVTRTTSLRKHQVFGRARRQLAWSPGGASVIASFMGYAVTVDTTSGAVAVHKSLGVVPNVSPSGQVFACQSDCEPPTVTITSLCTGAIVKRFRPADCFCELRHSWSPSGALFAVGDRRTCLNIWNTITGELISATTYPDIDALAWSPCEKVLATVGTEDARKTIYVFRANFAM